MSLQDRLVLTRSRYACRRTLTKKKIREILISVFFYVPNFACAFISVREWEARAGRRIIRRAAFDVGSGAVKMAVADVDLHEEVLPAVKGYLHTAKVRLVLANVRCRVYCCEIGFSRG